MASPSLIRGPRLRVQYRSATVSSASDPHSASARRAAAPPVKRRPEAPRRGSRYGAHSLRRGIGERVVSCALAELAEVSAGPRAPWRNSRIDTCTRRVTAPAKPSEATGLAVDVRSAVRLAQRAPSHGVHGANPHTHDGTNSDARHHSLRCVARGATRPRHGFCVWSPYVGDANVVFARPAITRPTLTRIGCFKPGGVAKM